MFVLKKINKIKNIKPPAGNWNLPTLYVVS